MARVFLQIMMFYSNLTLTHSHSLQVPECVGGLVLEYKAQLEGTSKTFRRSLGLNVGEALTSKGQAENVMHSGLRSRDKLLSCEL